MARANRPAAGSPVHLSTHRDAFRASRCPTLLLLAFVVAGAASTSRAAENAFRHAPAYGHDAQTAPTLLADSAPVPEDGRVQGHGAMPRDLDRAAAAAATPSGPPLRTLTVRRGDSLSTLFARAGLAAGEVQRVMALGENTRTLALLRPGEHVGLRSGDGGRLLKLRYALDPLHTLVVRAHGDSLAARIEQVQVTPRVALAAGTVNTALDYAMREAGIAGEVVAQFVNLFHWKVDFRREVQPGTRFRVVYRRLYRGGRALASGPVLAAELRIRDRVLRAFRFVDANGDARYYDEHGRSLKPSLLRTPVKYTRISSPFSHNRFDPVVHVWRPHNGVDLAAPIGTPVKAAADGTITFVGHGGGYGKYIRMRNFGSYATLYSHLSRFAPHIHRGSRVHQGQVIGYVGSTGESTGPHLLFEVRVAGKPRDPLKVPLPDARPLPKHEHARFESQVAPLRAALDQPQEVVARKMLTAMQQPPRRPGRVHAPALVYDARANVMARWHGPP